MPPASLPPSPAMNPGPITARISNRRERSDLHERRIGITRYLKKQLNSRASVRASHANGASPKRFARRRKRVGESGGAEPLGLMTVPEHRDDVVRRDDPRDPAVAVGNSERQQVVFVEQARDFVVGRVGGAGDERLAE